MQHQPQQQQHPSAAGTTMRTKLYAKCAKLAKQIETQINVHVGARDGDEDSDKCSQE